ncbi:RNA polymerase sigma factor [Rhodovulum visakhapatnamense]|uniref:RNA polymerase sigma factor n=1 Tax=Rhodovulum visakhapatnamense TaxID=364297 RepID=A0A4R8FJT0_9RHOB|nr:sigma-70 family RNA polymerase sigma factor [Rhodovulum visakhapatnamense]TDX25562.1 RNA polymerase ECF family sigma subunit [Rhodovulum visakhapatnamense]
MDPRQDEAEALMAALARGERGALARLVTLFGPGLRRYAAQALTVGSEAEDVTQEVFLRAWHRAGLYDPGRGSVAAWLYRIALRICIDRNRRGRFRRFVGIDAVAEPEDEAPGAEATVAARQRLARVRAAIRALPARQRQAILLRAAGELGTAEIARTLGISAGAAEQLLVRARAALRATVDREDHR